jgi:hypothetical protein
MESEVLAQELCDRMKEVVPPGITLSVEGDMLVFRSEFDTGSSGSYACRLLYEGTGRQSELVRDACSHAFSDLQDFVDEKTTEPWPGLKSPPAPYARIDNDLVIIWFGDSESPDLAIRPLLLLDGQ